MTILLVEDNTDDAMLTMRALSRGGITEEVVHKSDGVEALDYLFPTDGHCLEECGGWPVLVLLDLKLPRVDGLEVLRQIQQHGQAAHLNVVVFSSSDECEDIRMAYDLQANSYVRKPVEYQRFAETVVKVSRYWLDLNTDNISES
jgi:two-component system response regulator